MCEPADYQNCLHRFGVYGYIVHLPSQKEQMRGAIHTHTHIHGPHVCEEHSIYFKLKYGTGEEEGQSHIFAVILASLTNAQNFTAPMLSETSLLARPQT